MCCGCGRCSLARGHSLRCCWSVWIPRRAESWWRSGADFFHRHRADVRCGFAVVAPAMATAFRRPDGCRRARRCGVAPSGGRPTGCGKGSRRAPDGDAKREVGFLHCWLPGSALLWGSPSVRCRTSSLLAAIDVLGMGFAAWAEHLPSITALMAHLLHFMVAAGTTDKPVRARVGRVHVHCVDARRRRRWV